MIIIFWEMTPCGSQKMIIIIVTAVETSNLTNRYLLQDIDTDGRIYRVSEEERSIFWEVIVSVILSKKVYMYMCPIPNGFRDTAISLHSTLYTVQMSNTPSPHTSYKVHSC
jgi:hypothetical protein